MDWVQPFFERLYFPVFEGVLKRRQTAKLYQKALATQWQPLEVHEAHQLRAINALLAHTKTYCPYWRENTAIPEQLGSLGDLNELPVLQKADIRAYLPRMIAENHAASLWHKSTGGSTGEPLNFGYTAHSFEWRVAMSLRGYAWAGAPPGLVGSCERPDIVGFVRPGSARHGRVSAICDGLI